MRIGVMVAGSIGGYFGGMLARSGHQVTLIARGAHLEAIKQEGLRIIRDDEQFTLRCPADVGATDDPVDVGPVDLLLLTVKTYHNQQAVQDMLPMVGPDTTVLCLQNGIDSYEAAEQQVGAERVLPGAAYIEAGMPDPGVVTQKGPVVRIVFGEPFELPSKTAEARQAEEATDFMMRRVAALLPQSYQGAYGASSEGTLVFARQQSTPPDAGSTEQSDTEQSGSD